MTYRASAAPSFLERNLFDLAVWPIFLIYRPPSMSLTCEHLATKGHTEQDERQFHGYGIDGAVGDELENGARLPRRDMLGNPFTYIPICPSRTIPEWRRGFTTFSSKWERSTEKTMIFNCDQKLACLQIRSHPRFK